MSKKIAVVHNSLNPMGGGERLCLATIEAFKELGWDVVFVTVEPTDWSRVLQLWGNVVKPDEEVVLSIPIKGFTIYKRLITSLLIPRLRREVDVVINTHGDILVSNADITYMHFPTFALWDMSYHKYEHGFWRLYFTPYYIVQKRLVKKHVETLLLTNSRFSASIIYKTFKRKAVVVYPPVDVRKYIEIDGKRENVIVTIGRFSPEKRYEFIVEVAGKLPEYQFYIIGSIADTRGNRVYYEKIRTMIEEKELKNIELLPNISDKKMVELISTGKIYLHAMINEHFGVAVVEGMAGGLVPVVHKSGGAWTDIVEYGKYGCGYTNLEEAITCIRKAIENYDGLKEKARHRSRVFSKNRFKKKIVYVVKRYAELSR